MGTKGDKQTNVSAEACQAFVEKVGSFGEVTTKKMFGGYGIFESGTMFALVNSQGQVHLKTDDSNRGRYEEAGSGPHGRMPYYQIPAAILENLDRLQEWTLEAIAVSKAAKK